MSKTYDLEAVEYLAKLADGGMRDGITLLDKCLSYSQDLTMENIVKALGVVDYNVMLKLTDAWLNVKESTVIEILEDIHNEGKDLKQFIRNYLNYVMDIKKYQIFKNFDYISIPPTPENIKFLDMLYDIQDKDVTVLLNILVKLNFQIKYDNSPKYLIEAVLLGGIE